MNRDELKKHITNFRLNLPQGVKFAVIAQSTAVLESAKDLHCEYLYVAMDRHGYAWARMTYGEMETRLEGTWIGNSWLKVYPCYDEEHLVMVDGIPCQYVGETNPFQNDPMLERPVPKLEDFMPASGRGAHIRKLADILSSGMSIENGQVSLTDESIHDAMTAGLKHSELDGVLDRVVKDSGVTASLALTGKNVDFADVCGDYLGLGGLVDDMMESRSASKALLQNPISLKDSQYGEPQRWKRDLLRTLEYCVRKFDMWQQDLGFIEDRRENRRIYNNLSIFNKVVYKRIYRSMVTAYQAQGGKGQIVESMFHLRTNAVFSPLAQGVFAPGGHMEPDDHTVDALQVAIGARREMTEEGGFRRPGIARKLILGPQPFKFRDVITVPPEVKKTIDDFVGDDAPKKEDDK